MKKIVCYCIVLLAIIAGCEQSTSPGINSKIYGNVLDPDGNPVENAKILVNFNIDSEYPIGKNAINTSKGIDDPPIPEVNIIGNFPNPFNASTVIVFQLCAYCTISVRIEDNFDNEVKTIADSLLCPPGGSCLAWDGMNNDNKYIQNGAYNVVLSVENENYFDTLFVFKDYNEFSYDHITHLCVSDLSGEFSIQSNDLPLNYIGEQYDENGNHVGEFNVTPYVDIWAFHPNYNSVHVDSILVESGKDVHVLLEFE
jgi:hypothetical protein